MCGVFLRSTATRHIRALGRARLVARSAQVARVFLRTRVALSGKRVHVVACPTCRFDVRLAEHRGIVACDQRDENKKIRKESNGR